MRLGSFKLSFGNRRSASIDHLFLFLKQKFSLCDDIIIAMTDFST